MAGAALFPQAAVRGVGAVKDFSDSSLIMRLTRGRGWIGVLGALLVGIVALNVLSLSLSAGSGRLSLQIDELKTEVSALRAQIDERLSASRVQEEAARLGLAVPDPKAITYLSANDGNAARLAHMLGTDSFLLAPSLPSSYPANGVSYSVPEAVPTTPTGTTTTPPASTTATTPTTTAPSLERFEQRQLPDQPATRAPRVARPEASASKGASDAADRPPTRPPLLRFPADLLLRPRRSFWLQGVKGGSLSAEARSQQVTRVTIPGERGRVLDRNGKVLAASEDAADVIATPYQVENPAQTALRLHEVLGRADDGPAQCALRSQLRLRLSRSQGGCRRRRQGREAPHHRHLDGPRQQAGSTRRASSPRR